MIRTIHTFCVLSNEISNLVKCTDFVLCSRVCSYRLPQRRFDYHVIQIRRELFKKQFSSINICSVAIVSSTLKKLRKSLKEIRRKFFEFKKFLSHYFSSCSPIRSEFYNSKFLVREVFETYKLAIFDC